MTATGQQRIASMHLLAVSVLLICFCTLPPSSCLSDAPLLLVVSLDGFWYKYLTLYDTPNLNALASQGVRAEFMNNVFVTKTYPNHFTIATGYYEESHGIVGNAMYDPVLNATFDAETVGKEWWDNGNVIPIWAANELYNSSRHSGAMMWPGSAVQIHKEISDHLFTYDPNVGFLTRVDTVITWFQDPYNPANCVFLYYEEPDATGHDFGPFSPEVRQKVEAVDGLVGHMVDKLKAAGIFDRLNLIVLSDHGMAPVPGENAINLDDLLDSKMYLRSGTSPVWNILPVKGKEDFVYDALKAASNHSHFTVYRAEEIPAGYHYSRNRRVLSIVVVADEGWDLTTTSTAYMKANHTYGNHGYDNQLDSMHPLFIAHGPDFKVGYVSEPFDNVDLYPLMCYLLDIPVLPSDGSLDRAVFLLRRASKHTNLDINVWLVCIVAVLILMSVGLLVALLCVLRQARRLRRSMLEGTFAFDARGDSLCAGSAEEGHHLLLEATAS